VLFVHNILQSSKNNDLNIPWFSRSGINLQFFGKQKPASVQGRFRYLLPVEATTCILATNSLNGSKHPLFRVLSSTLGNKKPAHGKAGFATRSPQAG
jgi:hypothetical protein